MRRDRVNLIAALIASLFCLLPAVSVQAQGVGTGATGRPSGRSGTSSGRGYPGGVGAYYIPHIADGRFEEGSVRTTFIIVNTTDSYFFFRPLKFTDDNGNPLRLTVPEWGTVSEVSLAIPGAVTSFHETDGAGDLAVGAATLTAGAGLGVSAIFSMYDAAGNFSSEVGVAAAQPASDFIVPVDTTGLSNTGLALFNPGTAQAMVDLILRGLDGAEKGWVHLYMNSGAHLVRFVDGPGQWFPKIGEFRGTLSIQSTAPIVSLGLKQNGTPPVYTSVPALPRNSAKLSMYFPHVANGSFDGGSFTTSFAILNPGATRADVNLAFSRDDGGPLTVTIPGSGTNSTFDCQINPGAAVFVQTDGAGPLASGAATIASNMAIGASCMFTVLDDEGNLQTEAGVADAPSLKNMTVPINIEGSKNTGVALFNPGSTETAVTLRLIDGNGKVAGQDISLSLGGKFHIARFATDWFPLPDNFTGTLTIISEREIAALTLRQHSAPGKLSYTTLPVASGAPRGRAAPITAALPVDRDRY